MDASEKFVFGYRRRQGPSSLSLFELLYGVEPRLTGTEKGRRDQALTAEKHCVEACGLFNE